MSVPSRLEPDFRPQGKRYGLDAHGDFKSPQPTALAPIGRSPQLGRLDEAMQNERNAAPLSARPFGPLAGGTGSHDQPRPPSGVGVQAGSFPPGPHLPSPALPSALVRQDLPGRDRSPPQSGGYGLGSLAAESAAMPGPRGPNGSRALEPHAFRPPLSGGGVTISAHHGAVPRPLADSGPLQDPPSRGGGNGLPSHPAPYAAPPSHFSSPAPLPHAPPLRTQLREGQDVALVDSPRHTGYQYPPRGSPAARNAQFEPSASAARRGDTSRSASPEARGRLSPDDLTESQRVYQRYPVVTPPSRLASGGHSRGGSPTGHTTLSATAGGVDGQQPRLPSAYSQLVGGTGEPEWQGFESPRTHSALSTAHGASDFDLSHSAKRGWCSHPPATDADAYRLTYLQHLASHIPGQPPPNMVCMRDGGEAALPPYSLIQEQVALGCHTKAWLLAAHLNVEGTALDNVKFDAKGTERGRSNLLRSASCGEGGDAAVCSAAFSLLEAHNVGRTGLEDAPGRAVLSHSARLLLVHMPGGLQPSPAAAATKAASIPQQRTAGAPGNRFVGNCTAVLCTDVLNKHRRWVFNKADTVVMRVPVRRSAGRPPQSAARGRSPSPPAPTLQNRELFVYVELNTLFALTADELATNRAGKPPVLPSDPGQAAQVLTELNTCFALVPVMKLVSNDDASARDLGSSHRDRHVEVPLYAGDVLSGRYYLLSDLNATAATSLLGARAARAPCTLSILLPSRQRWSAAYPHLVQTASRLPDTCLLPATMCRAVEAYRIALAKALSEQNHFGVLVPDAALACIPAILDDPLLSYYFCKLLEECVREDLRVRIEPDVASHVRRIALQVGPALKMLSVRGSHASNYQYWHSQRHEELQALFVERDPASNLPTRFRGLERRLQDASCQHEPLTIQEMTLDLSEHAVPYAVHAC